MQQYADTAIDSAFGTQPYLDRMLNIGTIIQVSLIVAAFVLLFSIYSIIQKRERRTEIEKAVAEDASRAKTSFLSNMSHEIRTPMNAIIGLDNIALRNPDLQPETREQLLKIDASAKHLLGLINDILDMSRIESGRMVLKHEEFALRDFLEQVNIMINGQCQDKGLDYECRIEGPVSDYYVGDGMKLKQVLINILGNSVKFTEAPGEVSLSVKELERDGDTCRLRFTMNDSGIGMDEEFIPRLFEAFSQEDETATNRYGGSGLGMAITKSYVEMMKGEIHVESEKGRGSTFTVTVALGCSDRVYEAGTELSAETGLAGRRLLIAEDIDQNAEILLDLLDLEEIEADRAVNGKEAVEMFESSEAGYYDAVLMDVRMPVMDGLTATRTIRALGRPDAAAVPIIAMTANVYDEDVERSMQAGMNEHLSKPIEPEKLYDALARLIAEREG
ncbi:MAG: response regulator, partial [Firmicutes bacterium]|nr:response regulator [Bacillota bacterium]